MPSYPGKKILNSENLSESDRVCTSTRLVSLEQLHSYPFRNMITTNYIRLFILTLISIMLIQCENSAAGEITDKCKSSENSPGFYVEGRHLYDRCGEEIVLRGVNRMTVINDITGLPSFREIEKTGANAVRIMWMTWREAYLAEDAVASAIDLGMIPILELHDATGKWRKLEEVVDYWLQDEMLDIIKKYEQNMIVNIANEAGDHDVTDEQYLEGYKTAITRFREAGVKTPLMIDAAGWGRDEKQLLRVAPELLQFDPNQNLIFSWHPWDPGDQEERITNAMDKSIELDLPFVIGEFSHITVNCAGDIPYRHIMAEGERLGIGWLAWSWGPGNSDCESMDMTTDATFQSLQGWGLETAVTDPNSIKNTSVRPHSMVHGNCSSDE